MTDNEIIKALECCITKNNCTENCPYVDLKPNYFYCIEKSTLDAIDLLNRQQAEIERLKSNVFGMEFETAMYKAISESARAEAIKEFADSFDDELAKLRDTYFERGLKDYSLVCEVIHDYLYRTLREMVGDKNE